MNPRNFLTGAPALLLALSAMAAGDHAGGHGDSAIGIPGNPVKVSRTVNVDMTDNMRFHLSRVDIRQGETIRFVIRNSGKLQHEMVLGTTTDLKDHDELMRKHPGMEHADANGVTVAPGKSGEIIWQFTHAGQVAFSCLQPGHYEAGMKGAFNVAEK